MCASAVVECQYGADVELIHWGRHSSFSGFETNICSTGCELKDEGWNKIAKQKLEREGQNESAKQRKKLEGEPERRARGTGQARETDFGHGGRIGE